MGEGYVGINNKARSITNGYVGVSGKARTITKGYVGANGKAQLCYSASNGIRVELPSTLPLVPLVWTPADEESAGEVDLFPSIVEETATLSTIQTLLDLWANATQGVQNIANITVVQGQNTWHYDHYLKYAEYLVFGNGEIVIDDEEMTSQNVGMMFDIGDTYSNYGVINLSDAYASYPNNLSIEANPIGDRQVVVLWEDIYTDDTTQAESLVIYVESGDCFLCQNEQVEARYQCECVKDVDPDDASLIVFTFTREVNNDTEQLIITVDVSTYTVINVVQNGFDNINVQ